MKFLAAILLGMFTISLVLIQATFVYTAKAYPQLIFLIATIFCFIVTIILLIMSKDDK